MIALIFADLSDLRSKGSIWSWNNKNTEGRRIGGRLDRCLCNGGWLNIMPESFYEYLSPSTSDHPPCSFICYLSPIQVLNLFKFFNYWLKCAGFSDVLASTWDITVTVQSSGETDGP